MQISGKAKVVLLALLFCLYWSGFLSFAVRVVASALVSRLSAFDAFVRGQDAAKEDVRAAAKEAVKRDTEDMAGKMEDMISKMEKMVEDTDLAEMNSEEMKKTFGKLYDLFPMMDTLFERVLNAEVAQAVNPRGDFYEMQRRYDALRETLETKRAEKEEL
ncbi:uncharacterized protein [Penaeus vannamei]|uniref:uncharacterized protein n=1 Tax=Penaeus vannamei TaxID=6689 RepID=UPI00387F3A77